MEIPSQNQNPDDDELLTFLKGVCSIASLISTCQEIDPSGTLPSECKAGSAQWWAGLFGTFVAMYVLHDKEWRESLFNEGEVLINGKPTNIWGWDDIWGDADAKGTPDRLIPLVVGSLLSDYDDSRDYKALREHYLCMWSGSYTSYGKPLSAVGPEDDLYWAMRIGFVDTMLQHQKSVEEHVDLRKELADIKATIRDSETNISLRLLKVHREAEEKWHELSARLPQTLESISLRLKEHLGDNVMLVPERAFNYCVEGEQYSENITMQMPAITSFGNAVEASLKHYFVNSLVDYANKHGGTISVCFPHPIGRKTKNTFELGILSLRDWADILEMLDTPEGKSSSDIVRGQLREFMEYHFGGQKLPAFRPLADSLRKIQKLRNTPPHDKPREHPQQDLEQMRSLVLGAEEQTPVLVLISRLLAPQKLPD